MPHTPEGLGKQAALDQVLGDAPITSVTLLFSDISDVEGCKLQLTREEWNWEWEV